MFAMTGNMSTFDFDNWTVCCDVCNKEIDESCAVFQSKDKEKHICFACPSKFGFDIIDLYIPRAANSIIEEKFCASSEC